MSSQKKVLIIKTSSLGDVIHTLPALTDAGTQGSYTFDWVVEESFAEIASWHPLVNKVIPVNIRQWRKTPLKTLLSAPWKAFRRDLKTKQYDAVIDAQGLIKSAFLAPMARGHRYGLDKNSAREPFARHFYQTEVAVAKNQHAVERVRTLFAKSLGYEKPKAVGDYGINNLFKKNTKQPYLVFLHGTTWETKHYPESYWQQLIKRAAEEGLEVKLLWGNDNELERAKRLEENYRHVEVMPKLSLKEIAELLASAKAAIAVDTGLGHLAAAVDCPTLSLYGPTNPDLTGAYGVGQKHLSATRSCVPCLQRTCSQACESKIKPPCFETIPADIVWLNLQLLWA